MFFDDTHIIGRLKIMLNPLTLARTGNYYARTIRHTEDFHSPYDTVSTHHCNGLIPSEHSNRKVERCYDTNHTQWVPLLQQPMTRS